MFPHYSAVFGVHDIEAHCRVRDDNYERDGTVGEEVYDRSTWRLVSYIDPTKKWEYYDEEHESLK